MGFEIYRFFIRTQMVRDIERALLQFDLWMAASTLDQMRLKTRSQYYVRLIVRANHRVVVARNIHCHDRNEIATKNTSKFIFK